MDTDEDLSASTYTFDSSPTGPSSATTASGVFTPRGVGHTILGPSALSVLLARKQEEKRSSGLVSDEQVHSDSGHDRASTSEYPTSQMSLTPTNERPGGTYFSSIPPDTPRGLRSKSPPGSHPGASGGVAEPQFPDPQRTPDETTSLLHVNHATFYHEHASNGSQPMFTVAKTQPEHAKPVIPNGYGTIVFSQPSDTLRRILDPNVGRKAFRALPAVVLGTLLNILDGISCTCFSLTFAGCTPVWVSRSGFATQGNHYIRTTTHVI